MTSRVHIVDYGLGNLFSVSRAVEKAGGEAQVTDTASDILKADRLILPGVGAFRDGMAGLRQRGLDEAVQRFAESGRPLIGICLGMQMLATESEEFGIHSGLGLIPGRVVPIPPQGESGTPHKVPFIGWVQLEIGGDRNGGPLSSFDETTDAVYLVHSYHFETANEDERIAIYRYDGMPVTAVVARDNIFGCQFHPEKSGEAGLKILSAFLKIP